MRQLFFIFIALSSISLFGQGTERRPFNTTERGDNTGSAKSFVFRSGLGVLNPKLFTDNGNNLGLFSGSIVLGQGSAANISTIFDIGLSASNPVIRWNNAEQQLEFSNNGVDFNAFGTGSGGGAGGGGENFNNAFSESDNPRAEDGVSGWTFTGLTLTTITSATEVIEGLASFVFTPTAQNDFADSPVVSLNRAVFRGNSCEARVEYTGGDTNLSIQIIDADNNLLGQRTLPEHEVFGQESLWILCPSQSSITADPDVANVRYRLVNTGSSVANPIIFDRVYVGTLRGLTETQIPDTITLKVNENATIDNQAGEGLVNISLLSTGTYDIDFSALGLSNTPAMTVSVNDGSDRCATTQDAAASPTFTRVLIRTCGGDVPVNEPFTLKLTRVGSDARQRVQVFQSIPRVDQAVNRFSAFVSGAAPAGQVFDETVDFIDGNCSVSGRFATCNFISGLFTVTPLCSITSRTGSLDSWNAMIFNSTPNQIQIAIDRTTDGLDLFVGANITCEKTGPDLVLPIVQPVFPNQVQAFNDLDGVHIGRCTFNTNSLAIGQSGTSAANCTAWIDSFIANGDGRSTLNIRPGFSKTTPSCSCTAVVTGVDLSGDHCRFEDSQVSSPTRIDVHRRTPTASEGGDVTVICIGER